MIILPGNHEYDIVLHEKIRCRAITLQAKHCPANAAYILYPHAEPGVEYGVCGPHFAMISRGLNDLVVE